ncbi:MAG: hypothetical protein ACREQ9_02095, partial [Candidatus Binatia bacterium]
MDTGTGAFGKDGQGEGSQLTLNHERDPASPSSAARLSDLVWTDRLAHERRFEKSISALEAIALVLSRNRPLGGREEEFLELHSSVVGADEFARAWADPFAYFWVRRAYQLVATCLTGAPLSDFDQSYCDAIETAEPDAALALHLEDFKRFALALSWISRRDLSFSEPYRVRPPFA